MNKLILVLLVFCIGCKPKPKPNLPPPPPKLPLIQYELIENVDGVEFKITYFFHYNNGENWVNTKLMNLEDVARYKKQVEFLLVQLEEVEKKMALHEQLKETKNGN